MISLGQRRSDGSGAEGIDVKVESAAFERHYRVAELAKLWGLGRETLRVIVKDEPGVVKVRMGPKKVHTTYSVPESVAKRIHTRLLNSA